MHLDGVCKRKSISMAELFELTGRLFLMKVMITTLLCLLTAGLVHADTVPQYGRFEAAFTIPDQTGNPFDPAANDVDVDFAGPRGSHFGVPAFWDGDTWKVRFTPTVPGGYSATVSRNGAACGARWSTEHAFNCVKSKVAGFVRRSTDVTQEFVFDNGQIF